MHSKPSSCRHFRLAACQTKHSRTRGLEAAGSRPGTSNRLLHHGFFLTLTMAFAVASPGARAGQAWWHGVINSAWGDENNWYDAAPPNGNPLPPADDVAIFADGAVSGTVDVTDSRQLRQLVFTSNELLYELDVTGGGQLRLENGGIRFDGSARPGFFIRQDSALQIAGRSLVDGKSLGTTKFTNSGLFSMEGRSANKTVLDLLVLDGGRLEITDFAKAGFIRASVQSGGSVFIRGRADTSFLDVNLYGEDSELFLSGAVGPKANGKIEMTYVRNGFGSIILGSNQLLVQGGFDCKKLLEIGFQRDKPGSVKSKYDAKIAGTLLVRGNRKVPEGRYILIKSFGKLKGRFDKLVLSGFGPKRTGRLEYDKSTQTVVLVLN